MKIQIRGAKEAASIWIGMILANDPTGGLAKPSDASSDNLTRTLFPYYGWEQIDPQLTRKPATPASPECDIQDKKKVED